jgi:hypothetical protein
MNATTVAEWFPLRMSVGTFARFEYAHSYALFLFRSLLPFHWIHNLRSGTFASKFNELIISLNISYNFPSILVILLHVSWDPLESRRQNYQAKYLSKKLPLR